MHIILSLTSMALLVFLLTAVLQRHAVSLSLIDVPSARDAHKYPIPRGGGVTIVLVSVPFHVWLLSAGLIEPVIFAVLLAALPVAAAGLVDDMRSLHHRWRLLLQVMVSLWVVYLLGPLPEIRIGAWGFEAGWIVWLLVPAALIWLCNLYNFMDGIDSIAATQCLFVALTVAWWSMSEPGLALVALGLAAATTGFLYWNLPPAKMFLGDVGSTFMGTMLGLLALLTLYLDVMTLWAWVLLMGVFIADTGWTLIVRLSRGENCFHAHNTHAYQHAARCYGSHAMVVRRVLMINILWLLPLAFLAENYPGYGVYLAISGIVPLVWLAHRLGAGTPSRQPVSEESG